MKAAARINKRLALLLFRCNTLVQKYCTTLKKVEWYDSKAISK